MFTPDWDLYTSNFLRPDRFLRRMFVQIPELMNADEDLRLPREPGEAIWISRAGVREDLQRDLAVELGVSRLPHLAHAAFPEEGGDVVVPEA